VSVEPEGSKRLGLDIMHVKHIDGLLRPLTGPLTLAERLINLAADASDAGFPVAAEHLIHLADQVLDRPAELRC
jgi:hypothetical protein